MDWGVFHVEHRFLDQWRRYRRLLSQRNVLLKQGGSYRQVGVWDKALIEAGEFINNARRQWVLELNKRLPVAGAQLLNGDVVAAEYNQGWPANVSFAEALSGAAERDRDRGITTVGPHRADLSIRWGARMAQEWVSRGQQKLIAIALLVAQAQLFEEQTKQQSILLVDDPAAELDRDRLQRLLNLLRQTGAQLVLTGTNNEGLASGLNDETKMFHVEQGTIREVL